MPETATATPGEQIDVQPTLTTGLKTYPDYDLTRPALRVTWIHWHSAFRGTGLRVGDQILAVDGTPVPYPSDPHEFHRLLPTLIGQPQESQRWVAQAATEETPVTVTVRRRLATGSGWEVLDFRGRLRAERLYSDAGGQPLLGAGGPAAGAVVSFDFNTSWGTWYARFQEQASQVLDDSWRNRGWSSGHLFEDPLMQLRVDFLAKHYPGPFSQAVQEDWDAVRSVLAGRRFAGSAAGLAPREQEARAHARAFPSDTGLPPDSASPGEVLEAMVATVKEGDPNLFQQLFISWRAASLGDGRTLYSPREDYNLDRLWHDFRWLLSHRRWHARVVWTGEVYTLIPANRAAGVPLVEAVDVQLEHLSSFYDGHRPWTNGAQRDVWELQRLDGGPWRIASIQGL